MPSDPAPPDDGWETSAGAWIEELGDTGDYSRRHVLDAPMAARVRGRGYRTALDVGCGEGRFCRMMRGWGVEPVGIDPTEALLTRARTLDPQGDYRAGGAEALPFPDGAFDLVVSYLTLIDIPDVERAIGEMARVLRPGGSLLIANLNGFSTAGRWIRDAEGRRLHFAMDRYLESRPEHVSWNGIEVVNWHRPLSAYMGLLLAAGLVLRHFDEPAPTDASETAGDYRRAPWHLIMEWEKVGASA